MWDGINKLDTAGEKISELKDTAIESTKKGTDGNSLAVLWLGLHTFTAEGMGSIPGRGTKIPQDM